MNRSPEFDLLRNPLEGNNLIEASAGTGKTFTITMLILRLLIEKDLKLEQILVVTFTEAATNELKERARKMLLDARRAFISGKCEDKTLTAYIRQHGDARAALHKLEDAVRDFDEAAILTIHGFCNKVLQESAFESGGLFDTELVTEQSDILQDIVDDFWRQNMYAASGLFTSFCVNQLSPEHLFKLVEDKVGLLYMEVIPDGADEPFDDVEHAFGASYQSIRDVWVTVRPEVETILNRPDNGLNRNLYRPASIPFWLKDLDVYTASAQPNPVLPDAFEKFTSSKLKSSVRGSANPPVHSFFDLCETHYRNYLNLESAYKKRIIFLKRKLIDFVKTELKRRKEQNNIYFFDDLLLNLHETLEKGGEHGLVKTVRNQYRAALIDEFQDTDPVQYEIFRRIFGEGQNPLFLIGDPKQAIYGFRGADIFAYMRAKNEIPQHYTLSTNYRSGPELVQAINTLFQSARNEKPFIYDEIPYTTVRAADREAREHLTINGDTQKPLRIVYADARKYTSDWKPIRKRDARIIIVKTIAEEVARLLSLGEEGALKIGDTPLEQKDVAILVRSNLEARLLQEELTRVGVHSVLYGSANLFESNEARELELILSAVVEPKRESRIKAAICTEIAGLNATDFNALNEDEGRMEVWFERFARYHTTWQQKGFMRMLREMMEEGHWLSRLMSYSDGERRITNLLHLAEILNESELRNRFGMTGTLKWLSQQRNLNEGLRRKAPFEHQLRLESDENAVKLVTMHMSKGLEYPVVFCPFTWSGSWLWNASTFAFHSPDERQIYTFDLGSENQDRHKIFAEKEELAENLRLLYVAVTRAKHLCYLVWGRFWESGKSAPGYLMHQPSQLLSDDLLKEMDQHFRALEDEDLLGRLGEIAVQSGDTIAIEKLPEVDGVIFRPQEKKSSGLTCRQFAGQIDRSRRISSFSALISDQAHSAELPDYDSIEDERRESASVPEEPYQHYRTFPRGTRPGTFIHDILENVDFQAETFDGLVSEKLQAYGYEQDWQPAISRLLDELTALELGQGDRFRLRDISNTKRLNELEFYFPVSLLTTGKLELTFRNHRSDANDFTESIANLGFPALKGFMKGFMDLVFEANGKFYIADWKSNYLGDSSQDYAQPILRKTMMESYYFLQYHIYVVALNQYLHLRLPDYDYDRHFGGVLYFFLRGIDFSKGQDYGVFSARPTALMVAELTTIITGEDQ